MAGKSTYLVAVTETRRKVIAVKAGSEKEAKRRASDAWQNGEIILDEQSFEGAEFYVLGDAEPGDGGLQKIDSKDI